MHVYLVPEYSNADKLIAGTGSKRTKPTPHSCARFPDFILGIVGVDETLIKFLFFIVYNFEYACVQRF